MVREFHISRPFFEFGPKAYLYGTELLKLVREIDKIAERYDMDVIVDPQTVEIPMIVRNTSDRIKVFAQHMDSIPVGRGMGEALAEALFEAGAVGVMLNHAERKLELPEIAACIRRADEVGLATMVCADSLDEIKQIAQLAPNIIVCEPTELIGTGKAVEKRFVDACVSVIRKINPEILILPSAGISCGKDCYNIVRLGADASGSSSALCKAPDRAAMAEEMIRSVRLAYEHRIQNID